MTIPNLVLPASWEATRKVTLNEVSNKLGDGYTQDCLVGTQASIQEWEIRSPALPRTEAESILEQLETFQGITAFSWSPDNGLTVPAEVYYCLKWNTTIYSANAIEISGTFTQDIDSQCLAFASYINDNQILSMLEGAISFQNTYTRDTLPLVANAQGTTVNAFHTVVGRGGYFPPSVGTSEGQSLLIRGLLRAREEISNTTLKTTALNLAVLYANAYVSYFYQEAIPTNPTANLWLPHWLVNSKGSFTSKGLLASKFINSGYFGLSVSFVNGVGTIPSGNPNNGDKLSDVYRVYTTDGKLLWQNVYAPIVSGTEYSINYWVSNQQLLGTRYRIYPTSGGSSGAPPTVTTETAGTVVLNNTSFTGNLIVVYMAYVGATINKNEPMEAFPMWRPTQASPKEKNHALDVSGWNDQAFELLYNATGDSKWDRARQANRHSTFIAANVINDSYLFKVDTTATDPFSYPGTQLIIANNTSGGSASRSSGWVQASINNGSELYPVAELQNFAVSLQLQDGVTVDVNLGCSQTTILEVYLSLAVSALDDTQRYTFWQPVTAGVDVSRSILPAEFVKYDSDNVWHSRIADVPIYTYNGGGSTVSTSIGLTSISGNNRLTSTINFNQSSGGYAGAGFNCFNLTNQPPAIYYSKTGSNVRLKVTDSNSQSYFWDLPDTGGTFNTFIPTWVTSTTPSLEAGDGTIQNVEIVTTSNGSSTVIVWWVGASPKILPYPCISYKGAIVSRVDTAHTFKVGNFRGNGSPLATLKGSPGVIPFTANMFQDVNGNYTIDAWRGMAPFSGYQNPLMWDVWGDPGRSDQVLDFLLAAQEAYTKQSTNKVLGPFAPAFIWPSWESGVNGKINTWTFRDTIDPNAEWCGYQHRPLAEVAEYWKRNPRNRKAGQIVMRFLNFIDKYHRKNGNSFPPTNYREFVDPISLYVSIQESALIGRAALYANLAGGTPSTTYRVMKKSIEFIISEYESNGTMAGSFSKSQPTFTEGSFTGKEYFPFHHGEVMITLAEYLKYKNQIRYPSCATSLN